MSRACFALAAGALCLLGCGATTQSPVARGTAPAVVSPRDTAPTDPPKATEPARTDTAPRPKPSGGKLVRTFEAGQRGAPLVQWVTNLAVSADGKRLVTANARGLRAWDTATGALEGTFGQHGSDFTWGLALGHGGLALSGSDNGKMFLWDPASREAVRAFANRGPVRSVALSHDGRHAASGTYKDLVYLWNPETGQSVAALNGRQGEVCGLCFSPDDRRLLSAGRDGTVRLWEVASGAPLHTFAGHQGRVASAVFSPDGQRIASAGDDQTIRLWPAEGPAEPRVLDGHEAAVTCVAFSADGRWLISGSAEPERAVCVWDVAGGKEVLRLTGHGPGDVLQVALAPGGRHAFSAGQDGTVRMWLLPEDLGRE